MHIESEMHSNIEANDKKINFNVFYIEFRKSRLLPRFPHKKFLNLGKQCRLFNKIRIRELKIALGI